jgi:hypothetical protein
MRVGDKLIVFAGNKKNWNLNLGNQRFRVPFNAKNHPFEITNKPKKVVDHVWNGGKGIFEDQAVE